MDDKMIQANGRGQFGFTLMELLISMAIASIVSAGIFTAYQGQQKTQLAQKQSVEMQESIRAAVFIMTKELRMAGYDPGGAAGAGIINAGDGSDSNNRLIFTRVADNDGVDNSDIDTDGDDTNGMVDTGDGNIDEDGELQYIEYYLYDSLGDGTMDLGRRNGAQLRAIAENIQSLQFVYLDAGGNVTANISDISAVQFTIVATTDATELNRTGSNNTRTLTMTVNCRNLGI